MNNAFDRVVDVVMEYESDTFSAKDSRINGQEARRVADALIDGWINIDLDGEIISCILEALRER